MDERVIGVLGGMGPEATLNCFAKILRGTPAATDQEHLPVLIWNNPKVPDRTRSILNDDAAPLPVLADGCRRLAAAGADFVIIPCVTAHYFVPALREASELPILSILDAVVEHIRTRFPRIRTVGLMATRGTVQSGIFQKKLASQGIDWVTCQGSVQEQIMEAIYRVKAGAAADDRNWANRVLADSAQSLVDAGAEGIIAGCTEIPLALTQKDVVVPYFDSLLLLARAAIRMAGREPSENAD